MATSLYILHLLSVNPASAAAVFPRDYLGFDGHFPDAPLLPGFLHVQLALDLLREAGLGSELLEVTDAKFKTPILPEMWVQVTASPTGAPGRYEIVIAAEHALCSSFTLLAGFNPHAPSSQKS